MAHAQSIPASATAQDPIAHDSTQMSAPDPQIRRLTVSYGARTVREPDGSSAPAPMLRLQVAWLKRAGFAIGVPVAVWVSSERLVIDVAEPERMPQAEVLAKITRVAKTGCRSRTGIASCGT